MVDENLTYRFKYLKLISAIALECYECTGEDHLCSPGLLGKKSICKPDVTHCLKTWTGKCRILLLKQVHSKEIVNATVNNTTIYTFYSRDIT